MRFSDAIREGAKLGPQGITGVGEGICALRAAALAVGLIGTEHRYTPYGALARFWPELEGRLSDIWLLNDVRRWTRERIADWYEQNFEQPSDESLIAATVEEAKKHAAEPELVEA